MSRNHDVGTSSDGFLKVAAQPGTAISREQRAALIRRGNELFNRREIATAKRIFVTVRYSDGLIRIGNYLMEAGDPLEAFRMFWIAGDRRRVEEMAEKMAMVVRKWLREDEPAGGE